MAAVEKRSLGALGRIGVVAGMHVALVMVLASSFGLIPKLTHPDDIDVIKIDDPLPVTQPPPIVPFVPTTQDIFVSAPDDPNIERDDRIQIEAKVIPPGGGEIGPGRALPEPVPETGVRADSRHPLTQPRYPAQLIREGVEGAVDVEVYVQPDGRVGDARIAKTSGHDAFDRATLEEARRSWRLVPATRNGQAVAQWYRLRVSFRLKDLQ